MRALHWSLVSVLLCFICLLPEATQAKNASFAIHGNSKYILFVNQVRGEECCDPGTAATLDYQLKTLSDVNLPATFALRYDALNQKFLQTFEHYPREHEVAAFLEITPSLAHDAQVLYAGTAQNWYKAKYSYLIGYEPEDRVKLIDAYMEKFAATVGHFPKTTVAWMIDPFSLAYLYKAYGVTSHEITREQWGTDSYTLHGGPPHYPYFPSANWALVPTSQKPAMPLIFRQTVSDPLKNYGDFTSSFTSQPNDYLSGNKDFDYFKNLINQTLSQPGNEYAIAILGLENSMGDLYQKEFAKQIEYISSLSRHDSSVQVMRANQLSDAITSNTPSIVSGADLMAESETQAWWITTNTYRLRLLYDGNKLFINDIRLFDDSIPDPYLTKATSFQNGAWIAPFLLDSSRINKEYAKKNQKPFTVLETLLAINPFSSQTNSRHFFEPGASPDLGKTSPAIYLPKPDTPSSFIIDRANSVINLNYTSQKTLQKLQFLNEGFYLPQYTYVNGLNSTQKLAFDQSSEIITIPSINLEDNKLSWNTSQDSVFGLTINKNNESLEFKPFFKDGVDWNSVFERFAYAYNPEAHTQVINNDNTVFYAHNPQAITGNNPVRYILQGYDNNNLPIPIKEIKIDTKNDASVSVQIHQPTQFNGGWWIDVTSQSSGTKDLQIYFDGSSRNVKAYFIENCIAHSINCVKNPLQGAQFLKMKLFARIKSISPKK